MRAPRRSLVRILLENALVGRTGCVRHTAIVRLADVPHPETPTARAAVEVAAAYCSAALLNHCLRSYVWAAAYGTAQRVPFDAELLYVAAMLHDIGLVAEFDSHTLPFEAAGGHVAWVFGAGAGWPVERRTRAAEVVVRHMWERVDPDEDPEAYLLELATGLDISGRAPDRWPAELRSEVVARHPRLDLRDEFLRCFGDQARRKPESSAATAMRNGLPDRLATNVLDHDPG